MSRYHPYVFILALKGEREVRAMTLRSGCAKADHQFFRGHPRNTPGRAFSLMSTRQHAIDFSGAAGTAATGTPPLAEGNGRHPHPMAVAISIPAGDGPEESSAGRHRVAAGTARSGRLPAAAPPSNVTMRSQNAGVVAPSGNRVHCALRKDSGTSPGVGRVIDAYRHDERLAAGDHVAALLGEVPLEAKVPLGPTLCVG